jgi:hypothetical protein
MTARPSARCLSGLCLALMLAACGGGAGVDTAADDAAASAVENGSTAAAQSEVSREAGTTAAAPTSKPAVGKPGAPGGDPGDGAPDVEAQGNPGAPGDEAVFEEAGVPFSALRNDAAGRCADGVCTLLDPAIGAGNPDDVEGVDNCVVKKQSDIHYDPPAVDGLFQRGATVRATVDCTVPDSGTDDTGSPSTQDQVPPDEPQS